MIVKFEVIQSAGSPSSTSGNTLHIEFFFFLLLSEMYTQIGPTKTMVNKKKETKVKMYKSARPSRLLELPFSIDFLQVYMTMYNNAPALAT